MGLVSIAVDTTRQKGQSIEKVKLVAVNNSRHFYEAIGFHAAEKLSNGDVWMEMDVQLSQLFSDSASSAQEPFIFDDRQCLYDAFGHPELWPKRDPTALNFPLQKRRVV